MQRSGEIKIGNERNGLLCTKTCKTPPNGVLGEEKINNQPWCVPLKWTDELSTSSGSSRALYLMNQCTDALEGRGALSPPEGKAGSQAPTETRARSGHRAGAYQEGRAFLPTLPHPVFENDEWTSHISRVSWVTSILEFPNRRGQSWVIMDWFAICHLPCALFQHHIWQQEAL